MRRRDMPLLVVDGYNVIGATPRYQALIDEHAGAGALADVASLSRDPYGHDPFESARATLMSDVATYAQGRYDAVVVFDAAGNLSDDRPAFSPGGVRMVFSRTGESADTVIERHVVRARERGRDVLLVTSDNAIRATVGGIPVTTVSSQLLAQDMQVTNEEVAIEHDDRAHMRMTVEDRLSPEAREKLWKLIGR
ncbi:MAG: NYN domain-containing protein [Atopobiaceae bacterium]|nr:NYN domain-containing protein [Atopobiaceae bacterium]MBR3313014.1 NYN domain-containing protein [Atopobiaceae bacterium]